MGKSLKLLKNPESKKDDPLFFYTQLKHNVRDVLVIKWLLK